MQDIVFGEEANKEQKSVYNFEVFHLFKLSFTNKL